MLSHQPLAPTSLHHACDPDQFKFESTAELAEIDTVIGQDRALEAVKFGMRIRTGGYNVFALGPPGMGKTRVVRQVIAEEAVGRPIASDWCYVNNFEHPHKPKALELPAGQCRLLSLDMDQLIDELRMSIPAAFESENYQTRVQELEEEFKERHAKGINELREEAKQHRIALIETPGGFAFRPHGGGR